MITRSESRKLKVIFFNEVQRDGLGDFEHLFTIASALKSNPITTNFELYAVVAGPAQYLQAFKDRLDTLELNQCFVSSDRETLNQNRDLQKLLSEVDQIIIISSADLFKIDMDHISTFINPKALIKFIGEHEVKHISYFSNVIIRSLGLSQGTYGLKLKHETLDPKSDPYDVIQKNDNDFYNDLLKYSQCHTIEQFKQTSYFIPAYFQKVIPFIQLLLLLFSNKKLPDNRNITIYVSGFFTNWDDRDLGEELKILLAKTNNNSNFNKVENSISQVIHFRKDKDTLTTYPINSSGTKSILIIQGYRLSDPGFNAVFDAASFMTGISGDNTFEKTISKKLLPYYWSTHFLTKKATLIALYGIVKSKLETLDVDSQTKHDLLTYFDYDNLLRFIYHQDLSVIKQFQDLDLLAMAKAWRPIAQHLIDHHNFYDNLPTIFMEQLSPRLLGTQEPSVNQETTFSKRKP